MIEDPEGVRTKEIYTIGHALAVRIHEMSLRLPKFELYEEGTQIRKSSKSTTAQLVEGWRLRKYRDNFLFYLWRALGSADETKEHLAYLYETGSLKDRLLYAALLEQSEKLLAKLTTFIQGVEEKHTKPFGVS
jgi:four helix bundle protein